MNIFNILLKVIISFAVAGFSVFIMNIDPNFDGDSSFISFWIFVGMLFLLSLSLAPDKKSLEDRIRTIHKHRDFKEQLQELDKLIEHREVKRKSILEKQEDLVTKRKLTFERIAKLKKAVSLDMIEKNKPLIEDYTEKIEKIKDELESLDKELYELESELKLLYKENKSIQYGMKLNQQKKKIIEKKAEQVFKI